MKVPQDTRTTESQAPRRLPSSSGTMGFLLDQALRRALLRSLCYKLHGVWDRKHPYYSPNFSWLEQVDIVAEMIGDLVGLDFEEVHEAFDDNGGTGDKLIEELEPLLADGHGSWMTEECF